MGLHRATNGKLYRINSFPKKFLKGKKQVDKKDKHAKHRR